MSEDTGDELRSAVECLRDAEELVEDDDVADQLYAEAESLEALSTRDDAPDERRLSGHRQTLREHHQRVGEDARDRVASALDHVVSVEDAVGEGSDRR
ncbi:hypothetical protein [Halobacterium sp. CBA1126]|uniref:DUF7553 family protein n=1 Tax=Halobacterium sp. CBA1126 TaxID=2668074 RepID=UPI0012FBD736|nr:hypothetical protein [Halobacterium sp. CBA1126]MUV61595.1 hypothetical protein [Halobacterium sp. CBA1126]